MKFMQVKKGCFYGSEKNHSFWINDKDGQLEASVWMISPTPSSEPIHISFFDKKEDAEEYLNGISATIGLKQVVVQSKPLPNIKNAFEELLSKARMSMLRDCSGHGAIEIKMNLSINDYPLHRFIYDYKHTLDNANAGVDEHNEYLRLKAKYEGQV